MDPRVKDNPAAHRFEICVDGDVAGYAAYEVRDGTYVFTHTEVDPAYEGHGLASALVRAALDEMQARDAVVVPQCPFVRGFIARHDEYADLLPAA